MGIVAHLSHGYYRHYFWLAQAFAVLPFTVAWFIPYFHLSGLLTVLTNKTDFTSFGNSQIYSQILGNQYCPIQGFSLTQICPGQPSAWLRAVPDSVQLDSELSRIASAWLRYHEQCSAWLRYPGQRSAYLSEIPYSAYSSCKFPFDNDSLLLDHLFYLIGNLPYSIHNKNVKTI